MPIAHSYARHTLGAAALTLATFGTAIAQSDGAPDPDFGDQGFMRYEHSPVVGEPNIERGLHLLRRPDGRLAVLMQHRVQASSSADSPLIVVFDANGTIASRSLFAAMFALPPDPPITAAVDASGRALFVGDNSGQFLPIITALPGPPPQYAAELDAMLPVNSGASEFHRAVVGLPGGDLIVCGMRSYLLQAQPTLMPMCRRLNAQGGLVAPFGNNQPIGAGPNSFFLNESVIPGLQSGAVLSAQLDQAGRILLGGSIRRSAPGQDLAFAARLLQSGVFDISFCAGTTCSDAIASAPGWRADAIADVGTVSRSALIERGSDGSVLQLLDVGLTSSGQLAAALLNYDTDGQLRYAGSLLLGERTRIGFQLGVQADGKFVLPLSFRPDAATQWGAIVRVPADPAAEGLFDANFQYAPPGVVALAGVSIVRPDLPGGAPANSVECNAVLVEATTITCAGLVRVADAPLNLDMLLARVLIQGVDAVFANGFE